MIHGNRRFGVYDVTSVGELVENFTRHTWTLCTVFSLQDLMFCNDSLSEDGAQEYALVRAGQQIASLTVSWMSRAEVHNTLDWLLRGGGEDDRPVRPALEPAEDHHCPSCA